jgi:hypothetical protein
MSDLNPQEMSVEQLRSKILERTAANKDDQEKRKQRGREIHELSKALAAKTAIGYIVITTSSMPDVLLSASPETTTFHEWISFRALSGDPPLIEMQLITNRDEKITFRLALGDTIRFQHDYNSSKNGGTPSVHDYTVKTFKTENELLGWAYRKHVCLPT